MLKFQRILVPIVLTDASRHVMHQAAWLARRFRADIILLHVVTPLSYPAGILESGHEIMARDLQARIVQQAQKELDDALLPEFDGISVTRMLLRGDPAKEIVRTARERQVDLIVMSTSGHGAVYRFLLGSVTAKVLHESHCPVWTGAHIEEQPDSDFLIRRVLCSVELNGHSRHTASMAAEFAAAVDASLTFVHVTGSLEFYGPGGTFVDPTWKAEIFSYAATEIAKLQQDRGTKAEVVIDSGNVVVSLNRTAAQTKADVLIIGHVPGRSHLGDNGTGYEIIRDSHIPVLSV